MTASLTPTPPESSIAGGGGVASARISQEPRAGDPVAWRFKYRDGSLWNFARDAEYVRELNPDVFEIEPLFVGASVEAEIIRALPDIATAIEEWLFNGASDEDAIKPILAAMAEQRGALRQCQSALAMMINPDRITGTTIMTAFATATAAEAKARTLLGDE